MGQNSITMFTNDSGVAGGPIAYVQDAFADVTDTPSNNTGFSSTISSNPLNNLYGNDDFPRYGPKTLWIKDLVLVQDRAFWINGEPTYRIVWNEPFPSAQGYVFGNVQLVRQGMQTFVKLKTQGDGFGVGGVFARTMFLMIGNSAAAGSATGTVAVDGVTNATSVDWSNIAQAPGGTTVQNLQTTPMYAASVHAGANETYQIHDFRLTANQAGGVFTIAGVVVYSENSTLTIDQFPGTTYNNKSQSRTTANTTLPLPSFGNSLGGRSTIWKTANAGYSLSTIGVSTILSIAQGNNGTSILNLTVGTGANFLAGQGIITASSAGASPYVGIIQSISTDALTVYPSLPYGISNSIYTYFKAGQSLAINASLNILAYSYQGSDLSTLPFLDGYQQFCVWGQNTGVTLIDGLWPSTTWATASGFVQCEGYFSAAEIEWAGMSFGILSGTMTVNGLPAYSHANIGFTGLMKKTVFMDAGPGWNNFAFFPGSSHINVGVSRINLYTRRHDTSASFGVLAAFDSLQALVPRASNATAIPPGIFRRTFGDALLFKGPWVRSVGGTLPGGIAYTGSTTTCTLGFQYYGTQFAIVGGASLGAGSSLTISVDSGSNLGSTCLNTVVTPAGSAASLTFHSVSLAVLGGTCLISAIDFFRQTGEMRNLQTFSPIMNPVQTSQMPAGSILQIQQNSWNSNVANGNTAISPGIFFDVPNSAMNITPRSAASKILVRFSLNATANTQGAGGVIICRNGVPIGLGNAAGSRPQVSAGFLPAGNADFTPQCVNYEYLDAPNMAEPIQYKLQVTSFFAQGVWINQSIVDTNDSSHARLVSTLTLYEIAG